MARRAPTIAACVIVLALPPLNAVAAVRSKAVTKTVVGSTVVCHKWGSIQLHVKIAQSVVGGKVKFKILDITWPIWPQHVETISGATQISVSFKQSLQVALVAAAKA